MGPGPVITYAAIPPPIGTEAIDVWNMLAGKFWCGIDDPTAKPIAVVDVLVGVVAAAVLLASLKMEIVKAVC